MSDVPAAPAATRQHSRGLDVLTAILLGVVSLTTALGAWQASIWSREAALHGMNSADARDVSIASAIAWQFDTRLDTAALLQARKYALLEDEAIADQDAQASAFYNVMTTSYVQRMVSDSLVEAFTEWRADGFPADESPIDDSGYLAEQRASSDAYALAAGMAADVKGGFEQKAAIFTQAALINALALFLFGVAGINRLRTARFWTLVLGATAFLGALLLMATAY
jgi:hypothetical protein